LISIVVAPKNFGSRLILTVAAAAITIFLLITNYKIVAYFPFWLLRVAVRLMPSPIVRSKSISWTIVAVFTLSCKFSLSYFLHASDIVLQSTSDALLACTFANLLLTSMYSQNVPNESGARINLYLAVCIRHLRQAKSRIASLLSRTDSAGPSGIWPIHLVTGALSVRVSSP
jgi:hypothetical protein